MKRFEIVARCKGSNTLHYIDSESREEAIAQFKKDYFCHGTHQIWVVHEVHWRVEKNWKGLSAKERLQKVQQFIEDEMERHELLEEFLGGYFASMDTPDRVMIELGKLCTLARVSCFLKYGDPLGPDGE